LVVPQSTCLKYGVFCVAILHAKDLVFYGVNFRVPCCSLPYCLQALNKERKQKHMRRITYRKAAAVAMAAALSAALLVGCGSTAASTDSAATSTVADESTAEDAEKTADEGDAEEELPPQAAMLRAMEPAMPSASTLLNFFICFSPLLV
jgi:sugar phosphate isomerase/epimerase